VRPHDIELLPATVTGATEASVARVVRLGFEVRVELAVNDSETWVQVTRETADRLNLAPGKVVYLRASEHAIRPQVPSLPSKSATRRDEASA
jgi:sulfate/thiosulfate transport system ATP-binding protein